MLVAFKKLLSANKAYFISLFYKFSEILSCTSYENLGYLSKIVCELAPWKVSSSQRKQQQEQRCIWINLAEEIYFKYRVEAVK